MLDSKKKETPQYKAVSMPSERLYYWQIPQNAVAFHMD